MKNYLSEPSRLQPLDLLRQLVIRQFKVRDRSAGVSCIPFHLDSIVWLTEDLVVRFVRSHVEVHRIDSRYGRLCRRLTFVGACQRVYLLRFLLLDYRFVRFVIDAGREVKLTGWLRPAAYPGKSVRGSALDADHTVVVYDQNDEENHQTSHYSEQEGIKCW